MTLWAILLAGGQGQRMGTKTPKQYLDLAGSPVALHSFHKLANHPSIEGIVVVCDEKYEPLFTSSSCEVVFARAGSERLFSLKNGLQKIPPQAVYLCIHDAARPLVTAEMIDLSFAAAIEHGAAAIGVPVKGTIKVCDSDQKVLHQPERSTLWEMQTPQVVRRDILEKGIEIAEKNHLAVTDDIALADLAGIQAKIVYGSYTNIKITTAEDLTIAHHLINLKTAVTHG